MRYSVQIRNHKLVVKCLPFWQFTTGTIRHAGMLPTFILDKSVGYARSFSRALVFRARIVRYMIKHQNRSKSVSHPNQPSINTSPQALGPWANI